MFRKINHFWQKRRERFYLKNRWHLILDYSLGIIILLLVGIIITLSIYQPKIDKTTVNIPIQNDAIDLNNPPLSFSFTPSVKSIKLNSPLELKINFKNSSQLNIYDVKATLLIIDKNFSIDRIEKTKDSLDLEVINNQLILSSLSAKENRELSVLVYFKDKTKLDRIIKWQSQSEYAIQGQLFKELISLPDINLAAELEASARAYYNSPQGDQLGSGPLPPVVSLPTNYWVFFDVMSAGDFKNLVFSAKLGKEVELTDRRSLLSGDFKYNSASRQIVWTVPELKNQSDSYRVGFEIQFVPTEAQLNKTPFLISDIKYYAHDNLINGDNSGELPSISTNLDYDRINKGQGKVILPE